MNQKEKKDYRPTVKRLIGFAAIYLPTIIVLTFYANNTSIPLGILGCLIIIIACLLIGLSLYESKILGKHRIDQWLIWIAFTTTFSIPISMALINLNTSQENELAKKLIVDIEAYRTSNDEYPESLVLLESIDLEEYDLNHYTYELSDSGYTLIYYGFNEYKNVYHSKTKTWSIYD